MTRTTRQDETREQTTHDSLQDFPSSWRPAGIIPAFNRKPGWDYKMVSFALRGQSDSANVQRALTEGWRMVHPSEHPELAYLLEIPGASQDRIESGGLVLCKMPLELAKQRDRYNQARSSQQVQSVDAQLKNEFAGDTRVELINERRTEQGFGTGSL
jgi:hypothetical protein